MAKFSFSQEWFDKTIEMRPLFNRRIPTCARSQQRGDKIILWNGAEDNVVEPAGTISLLPGRAEGDGRQNSQIPSCASSCSRALATAAAAMAQIRSILSAR